MTTAKRLATLALPAAMLFGSAAGSADAAGPFVRALQGVLPVSAATFRRTSSPAPTPFPPAPAPATPRPRLTPDMIFDLFDRDGDGSLSRAEFAALRKSSLGMLMLPEWAGRLDADALFTVLDLTRDGFVDRTEFLTRARAR